MIDTKPTANEKILKDNYIVLIFVAMLLSACMVYGGYAFHRSILTTAMNQVNDQLSTVGDLKVREIDLWRFERFSDATFIFNNSHRASEVDSFLRDRTNQSKKKDLWTWLANYKNSYHYESASLIDEAGNLILSTDDQEFSDTVHPELSSYAMRERKVTFGELRRHAASGKIVLSVYAPLMIQRGDDPYAIGCVELTMNAQQHLFPMIQQLAVSTDSAEVLLVRKDGDSVLFMNDLRHRNNTALLLRIPLTQDQIPAVQTVKGISGTIEGTDYRGVPVMAYGLPVPDSSWFVIAKIDLMEAIRPVRKSLVYIIAAVIGAITLIMIFTTMYWYRSKGIYYRTIAETKDALLTAEKKYRKLHESMRDGFVFVDMEGRIKEFNETYRDMLGYNHDEIEALTYIDITPEKWHKVEKKIVAEQILPKGFSEVYEKEYRRKDGTVFPVELRTILIKSDDGTNEGMWAIVRDITERKKLEDERERNIASLQRAQEKIHVMRGMLPICSYCKKIRNDKGYWDEVASFISSHSEASFTHGICPDCEKKAYEELRRLKHDNP